MENGVWYSCTHTAHITRKRKVWQDGFVRVSQFNRKAALFEAGETMQIGKQVESIFLRSENSNIYALADTEIQFERHIVQFAELLQGEPNSIEHTPVPTSPAKTHFSHTSNQHFAKLNRPRKPGLRKPANSSSSKSNFQTPFQQPLTQNLGRNPPAKIATQDQRQNQTAQLAKTKENNDKFEQDFRKSSLTESSFCFSAPDPTNGRSAQELLKLFGNSIGNVAHSNQANQASQITHQYEHKVLTGQQNKRRKLDNFVGDILESQQSMCFSTPSQEPNMINESQSTLSNPFQDFCDLEHGSETNSNEYSFELDWTHSKISPQSTQVHQFSKLKQGKYTLAQPKDPKSSQLNSKRTSVKLFHTPRQLNSVSRDSTWLYFPSPEEIASAKGTSPHCHHIRKTFVPNQFENCNEYSRVYTQAVLEELQFMVFDYAESVWNIVHRALQFPSKSALEIPEKHNINSLIHRCVQQLRSNGFMYYTECEILKRSKKKFFSNCNKEENEGCEKGDEKLFLQLSGFKEKSTCYSKDDLWIIFSTNIILQSEQSKGLEDAMFVRSLYHGPTPQGMMEISTIDQNRGFMRGKKKSVWALRAFNLSMLVTMLDTLKALTPHNPPILPLVMSQKFSCVPEREYWFVSITRLELEKLVNDTLLEFELNEDQGTVLRKCACWFTCVDGPLIDVQTQQSKDIVLVHGPFGSGKSYLVVAIIIFIAKLIELDRTHRSLSNKHNRGKVKTPLDSVRILVTSSTNVAVDRILLGLLKRKFLNFGRIGSLKRIAKPLLPYVLQFSQKGCGVKEAIQELRDMLNPKKGDTCLTADERRSILETIDKLQREQVVQRKRRLLQTRVIGATCAASVFPIMDNIIFPIVILDECSQMLEPISLIPVARAQCEKLLAVGDPLQLPPQLVYTKSREGLEEENTLKRTMFVRLNTLGIDTILLKTQYRCHPQFSSLSNSLFYENRLCDGITCDQRNPISTSLPPLVFCDVIDGCENFQQNSYTNDMEAQVVVEMLHSFHAMGTKPQEIGVICLYKAQVTKIRGLLDTSVNSNNSMGEAQSIDMDYQTPINALEVSTVDAFQGAEREIIIVSCCRTRRLGFVDSPERLNVTITRARRHLILVGKSSILEHQDAFAKIIESAKTKEGGFINTQTVLNGDFRAIHMGNVQEWRSIENENCLDWMHNQGQELESEDHEDELECENQEIDIVESVQIIQSPEYEIKSIDETQ